MTNETTKTAPTKRFGKLESLEIKPTEKGRMAKIAVDCGGRFTQYATAFKDEIVAALEDAGVGASVWFLGVFDDYTKDDGSKAKSMRIITFRHGDRPAASTEDTPVVEEAPAVADDLTQVKGIGAAFAAKLEDAGITTFAALAEMNDEALDAVAKGAAKRAENAGWKAQAVELASVAA